MGSSGNTGMLMPAHTTASVPPDVHLETCAQMPKRLYADRVADISDWVQQARCQAFAVSLNVQSCISALHSKTAPLHN